MRADVVADLERYGPGLRYAPVPAGPARAYCRRLARSHYENFTVASLLLPRDLARHFHNVYAWCRWADDLADETGGGAKSLRLLRWWRESTLLMYRGRACHPVFVALRETVERFAIPPRPFLDLLFAFEQDQLVKRYSTFDQLAHYCKHSANPVGHLVLYLCGCHNAANAALSDHICTALQLANFWQDVSRDYEAGRVYLPDEDRKLFSYRDEDLRARRFTPQFVELMRFEVGRARDLFARGEPLLARVPPAVRVDIDLFLRGGLATLHAIEDAGFNVWYRRPKVGRLRKLSMLLGAAWRNWQLGRDAGRT